MGVFGEGAKHEVFGDFEPLGQVETPAYYVHRIQKKDSDSCALASKPEPELKSEPLLLLVRPVHSPSQKKKYETYCMSE